MNHLERIQDVLPPIYAVQRDAVLSQFLAMIALEIEALEEDIDRMRRTHWVHFAYRLTDLEKIAALMGIEPFPWESLPLFRERLLARVAAQLRGALGPTEIKQFVYSYLLGVEQALSEQLPLNPQRALKAIFVPGLQKSQQRDFDARVAEAFAPPANPRQRKLALVENPRKLRRSATLLAISGRVPYLYRWSEYNRGLSETVAGFDIGGLAAGRTAVPLVVNRTTGDLLGYRGVLRQGQTLVLRPADAAGSGRGLIATIDGRDVSGDVFSVSGFVLGVPFEPSDVQEPPQLPRMARGKNEWIFLSVGLYDMKGLNHVFFAIADEQLREGLFDQTTFDHALFPSGPVAKLAMQWIETEPASFEVHVPRYLVVEPAAAGGNHRLYTQVAEALRDSINELHAAGVRADVIFAPFVERQPQTVRVTMSWKFLDPERAPSGRRDTITLGGRFGESGLNDARFE